MQTTRTISSNIADEPVMKILEKSSSQNEQTVASTCSEGADPSLNLQESRPAENCQDVDELSEECEPMAASQAPQPISLSRHVQVEQP